MRIRFTQFSDDDQPTSMRVDQTVFRAEGDIDDHEFLYERTGSLLDDLSLVRGELCGACSAPLERHLRLMIRTNIEPPRT